MCSYITKHSATLWTFSIRFTISNLTKPNIFKVKLHPKIKIPLLASCLFKLSFFLLKQIFFFFLGGDWGARIFMWFIVTRSINLKNKRKLLFATKAPLHWDSEMDYERFELVNTKHHWLSCITWPSNQTWAKFNSYAGEEHNQWTA